MNVTEYSNADVFRPDLSDFQFRVTEFAMTWGEVPILISFTREIKHGEICCIYACL